MPSCKRFGLATKCLIGVHQDNAQGSYGMHSAGSASPNGPYSEPPSYGGAFSWSLHGISLVFMLIRVLPIVYHQFLIVVSPSAYTVSLADAFDAQSITAAAASFMYM